MHRLEPQHPPPKKKIIKIKIKNENKNQKIKISIKYITVILAKSVSRQYSLAITSQIGLA